MGSGLIAWQKSPGRRKTERKQTGFLDRTNLASCRHSRAGCLIGRSLRFAEGHADFDTGQSFALPGQDDASHRLDRTMLRIAGRWVLINESDQANRVISTGKLHTLLCFHTRPINVVVYHDSQGRTRFEVGFPLRCIQRLSSPYIATLHCGWRHNRSTRGTFTPVLSY